jgi:hypothetical protein
MTEQRIEAHKSDYLFWKRKYERDNTSYARNRMNTAKHFLFLYGVRVKEDEGTVKFERG